MDDAELVLSDVHMDKTVDDTDEKLFVTRFRFWIPFSQNAKEKNTQAPEVLFDEDGDIIRPSATERDHDVIILYHSMATTLSDVGLQVWRGGLFLCDYIIHNRDLFSNKHVLELGSGTGLAGIVAGQFADTVTCTDVGDDVINLCRKNVEENFRLHRSPSSLTVKALDWLSDLDLNSLDHQPEIVMAADCVYDNRLTDALFNILKKLIRFSVGKHYPIIFIALEKRLNFTIDVYDVTCHEYDHFCACLRKLESFVSLQITHYKMDDIPMYFEYNKTDYVELWKIQRK